ncbi:glycosyltransferase [Olivibacter ginsenosidimutans]|uniref:Glycosyltransferase n=1 Tax=Olivibacter ginsenosidimutans TaxID=1176537 RepID=A0ABP9AS18_9SPHI
MDSLKICIIKPNKSSYSETFIQTQIELLPGEKQVLYGGDFPVYQPNGKFLIKSVTGILSYLIQKRLFKKRDIAVRNSALVNYLKAQKINVVLAQYGTVGATITKACAMAEVPLVIHFHGVDAHRQELLNTFKDLYKKAFAYASALIVVSNDMRESLLQLGADANKIHLIPYGVRTDLFKPVRLSAEPHFLSIGRLVDKKAPIITLNAFAQVAQQFPTAHLSMVGDGPLAQEAKARAKALNIVQQVTFTGVLDRKAIIQLMSRRTYAYVQHSVTAKDGDMEGTPNTVLEASAAGLPIVSTRHAGIKEAVIEGVTGFLVDEYDQDAMAQHMLTLAASRPLAEQMGQAARQHMVKHYDIQQQIAKLNQILLGAAKIRA